MTLNDIALAATQTVAMIKANLLFPSLVLAFLWCVNIIGWLCGGCFRVLGIYPRHLFGLPGIIFSPIVHANADHLFFNSLPLFILMAFLMALGIPHFLVITVWIVLISGSLLWLVGRKAIHLGASGVIMGYWGYILARSWFHPSMSSIMVSLIILYYLGGMFLSLFPSEEKVSWEGHCCGAIAGVITAYGLPW